MIRSEKRTNEVPTTITFDTQADKQSVALRTGSWHSGKLDTRDLAMKSGHRVCDIRQNQIGF